MLINLRNALMTGKRLPYDAEVEYLESSGTQYIDIPVSVSAGQFFEVAGTISAVNLVMNAAIFEADVAAQFHSNRYSESSSSIIFASSVGGVSRNGGWSITPNKMTTFALSTTGKTIDGVFTALARPLTSALSKIRIFGPIRSSTFVFANVRFAAIKITVGNNVVFDGIPVRKGTVGYLYDRVSGKLFGNAGTGDFVLGPDVVPVEWLGSDGNQYIDTGVYGSQNLRTTFDYQLEYSGTAPVAMGLFGCYTSGMKYHLYCSGAAPSEFQVGMGNTYLNTIRVDNVRHSIKFDDGAVSIDGNVVATFGTYEYTTAHTLLLFALHNTSGGLYSMTPMRKWRVQMWDNGTPIRDYVPVRVGTDATSWEGAMMDVLTRRVYRNAGTGAFTYGNDLKYPIPSE